MASFDVHPGHYKTLSITNLTVSGGQVEIAVKETDRFENLVTVLCMSHNSNKDPLNLKTEKLDGRFLIRGTLQNIFKLLEKNQIIDLKDLEQVKQDKEVKQLFNEEGRKFEAEKSSSTQSGMGYR